MLQVASHGFRTGFARAVGAAVERIIASAKKEGGLSKAEEYRKALRKLNDWDAYLRKHSGLPGPRANLELAQVVAEEGDPELFERYLQFTPAAAPENTPDVFLAVCGVVGLGRLAAEAERKHLPKLRELASDPRWRIRESVAMALQRVGDENMILLLDEMDRWSQGNPLEQRAAAAALCEPRLLNDKGHSRRVLDILDTITASIHSRKDRKNEAFIAFRKGMGYCWSVAVAANPEYGKRRMEKWITSKDKDVLWIMKENLKKSRLIRCDERWVGNMIQKIK
jgi:hypothetical protein